MAAASSGSEACSAAVWIFSLRVIDPSFSKLFSLGLGLGLGLALCQGLGALSQEHVLSHGLLALSQGLLVLVFVLCQGQLGFLQDAKLGAWCFAHGSYML